MSDKIRRDHLERAAYVYVRQSTPHQVRNHLESKERQYDRRTGETVQLETRGGRML